MTHRFLKALSMVTYCVDDMDSSRDTWVNYLGYRVVDSGHIDSKLAAAWNAPAAAGSRYCLLAPESDEPVYIRYIETGERYGYESPATQGWTATELLVENPDELARSLRGSPLQILAGPGDLFPGPKSPRAMQTIGPCGELLYFTRILPGGSRYGMKQARSPVDRPFIVTICGDAMAAMSGFYGDALGLRVMPPLSFINGILAHSCGAPADTVFPTAISPLPGRRFLIEMDECPPELPPRPKRRDQLVPGMSMVSFSVEHLDTLVDRIATPPRRIENFPYSGNRVTSISGGANERLELIENHQP